MKIKSVLISIGFIFLIVMVMVSCNNSIYNPKNESNKYYKLTDFDSIIIGESTYFDLCVLAPPHNNTVTSYSYGFACDYPKEGGGVIRVKLTPQGDDINDFIVFSIEVIE